MLILTEFMIMLRQPWCAPTSIIEWSRLTVVETKWEGGDSCGYAEESLPSPAEFSFKLRPAFEMIFTWRQMPTAPMNMMWKTNKSDRMEKLKWAGWGGDGKGEGSFVINGSNFHQSTESWTRYFSFLHTPTSSPLFGLSELYTRNLLIVVTQ